MKTMYHKLAAVTIQSFCEAHNYVMHIYEKPGKEYVARIADLFLYEFDGAFNRKRVDEIYGTGTSPEIAVSSLAAAMSERELMYVTNDSLAQIMSGNKVRTSFKAPVLYSDPEWRLTP